MDGIELNERNKMILKRIGVDVINESRNYWFLRTQGGTYYDNFITENFVGIEWDKISDINFIKEKTTLEISGAVSTFYPKIDKHTYVAGQIKTFICSMKKGDIVLIPNKMSRILSFGVLEDDEAYVYEPDEFELFLDRMDEIAFERKHIEEIEEKPILKKRRKVFWLKHIKRSNLDPYLYRIIYAHNTIVDARNYDLFIDRALSYFYIKGNEAYFTFKVNKRNNITYASMLKFLNNISMLIDYINKHQDIEKIELDDLAIKMGVQSKGTIQVKGAMTKVFIVGLVIVGLFGGKVAFKKDATETSFEMGTEGLPRLISTIKELFDTAENVEKEAELQKIEDGLQKNLNELELSIDNN